MSYVTFPPFCRDDAELDLATARPSRRVAPAVREALKIVGGGVLFAVTLYSMIVLSGLL